MADPWGAPWGARPCGQARGRCSGAEEGRRASGSSSPAFVWETRLDLPSARPWTRPRRHPRDRVLHQNRLPVSGSKVFSTGPVLPGCRRGDGAPGPGERGCKGHKLSPGVGLAAHPLPLPQPVSETEVPDLQWVGRGQVRSCAVHGAEPPVLRSAIGHSEGAMGVLGKEPRLGPRDTQQRPRVRGRRAGEGPGTILAPHLFSSAGAESSHQFSHAEVQVLPEKPR